MYGLLAGCERALCGEARRIWQRHLCGLCESLSRAFGPAARMLATPDAALLSLLVEAQAPTVAPDTAPSRCLARRPFHLQVPSTRSPGSRFARSVAVAAAAARLEDAARDGDLGPRWLARWAGAALRPALRRAERHLQDLGFDPATVRRADQDAARIETTSRSFDALCAPAEGAYAAVFGHTMALAGRAERVAVGREVGRWFGRLTYLEDARRDHTHDLARGRFNALNACFGAQATDRGADLAAAAAERLRDAVGRLRLVRHGGVVAQLLSAEVNRRIAWACGGGDGAERVSLGRREKARPPVQRPRRRGHWSDPSWSGDDPGPCAWCCRCGCDPCFWLPCVFCW